MFPFLQVTFTSTRRPEKPLSTQAHPPTQPQQTLISLPCCLALPFGYVCGPGSCFFFFFIASTLLCSFGIAEVNPPLPGNGIKQWSQ